MRGKLVFLFVALTLLVSTSAFAQGWTDNGDTVTLITPTDRVGIGAAPNFATALYVRGQIVIGEFGSVFPSGDNVNTGGQFQLLNLSGNSGFLIRNTGPSGQSKLTFTKDLLNVIVMENNGNVGIGVNTPTTKLHVGGDLTATGSIVGSNVAATYQDVAEWVPATENLTAGTVVVLNTEKNNEVMASHTAYDTSVAGVVSAQPGLILGVAGNAKEMVATTGRVKVRVDANIAPIKVGDLLVTSNRSGIAMKSEPVEISGIKMHRPGTIIGKALEPLAKGEGEILVLLSMQ